MSPSDKGVLADTFHCTICNRDYAHKKNLMKHLRTNHNATDKADILKVRKIKCSVKDCSFMCRWMNDLRDHIRNCHNIQLFVDSLQFLTNEDFTKWKKAEEARSVACFISFRQKTLLKGGGFRQILSCHRSGVYNPKGSGKNRMKYSGSRKIGRACPAAIQVTELPENGVHVLYHKTHVGHASDVQHLPLTKEDRLKISGAIQKGFSLDAILEEVKESFKMEDKTNPPKRIHLLSRKDLHNIMKSSRVSISWKKKKKGALRKRLEKPAMAGNAPNQQSNEDDVYYDQKLSPKTGAINTDIFTPATDKLPDMMEAGHLESSPKIISSSNFNNHPSTNERICSPSSIVTSSNNASSMFQTQRLPRVNFKSNLTECVQEKLNTLFSSLQQTEYLTPKQFELLTIKLDGAIKILEAVTKVRGS